MKQQMKHNYIFLILITLLFYIFFYIETSIQKEDIRQIEDMTQSLMQTTANYLHMFQNNVNSWSNHIHTSKVTIKEGIEYLLICKGNDSEFDAQIVLVNEDTSQIDHLAPLNEHMDRIQLYGFDSIKQEKMVAFRKAVNGYWNDCDMEKALEIFYES